ncbi:MAG: MFS transporter [Eggerthellales bacterium]|nr:MFS transporter [Eggerthellales bacterium]
MSNTKPIYSAKVGWLAMLGGLFIYFTNSACQYKVPPIMGDLCDALGMTLGQAGWLMSIMSLLGLILAIPAGFIIMKLGTRNATVLTAVINLIGSVLGTFATGFGLMMFSRALEGVALGLVSVVSFQVSTAFFPAEKRGLPNACVTVAYVLSYFAMMNAATPLNEAFGWQGLWWACNALSVIAVILAWFCIPKKANEPDFTAEENDELAASNEKVSYKKIFTNPGLYAIAICFVVFNIGYYGITTYMPTYLTDIVGADAGTANFAISWNAIAGAPAALVAGFLMGKVGLRNRKWVPAIAMLALAVMYFFAFQMPNVGAAAALLIVCGFVASLVPPSLYTIGPDLIPKAIYAPMILAVVTFGQNLGMTLGPLVVGYTYEAFGTWSSVSIPIGVLAVIGALAMAIIKSKAKSE